MSLNGLLLLTSSASTLRSKFNLLPVNKYLIKKGRVANVLVSPVLYVVPFPQPGAEDTRNSINSRLWNIIYSQGNSQCPSIDIRVIPRMRRPLDSRPIDLVMVEGGRNKISLDNIKAFVNQWFQVSTEDYPVEYLKDEGGDDEVTTDAVAGPATTTKLYEVVILGGTFDRMHNAHKILLTEAVAQCSREIMVGVTSDEMIKNKLLYEFIEPCPTRLERVKNFLADVAPNLVHRVVEINDPFGPSVTEKDIGLIVVSAETIKGAQKINEIRAQKLFPPLDVHHIVLFQDELKQSEHEEDKISSSSQRIRILGDRLQPPRKPPSVPYIIGLTGGIASGKSTLCGYLETLGLPTINCDVLGHDAYLKGTPCFDKIVSTFGADVLKITPDGSEEINRKALGTKVFNNPDELRKLSSIVWPEIQSLAQQSIDKLAREGHKAIVLDAAVLLEAGWDELCHDVWVVVLPKEETIKRVMGRDGLSAEDAEKRVAVQVSNHERVQKANFVFCSLWEVDFTRRQADKAWREIKSIIDTL